MTNEEKFQHDLMTANFNAPLETKTDMEVLMNAAAMLLLDGKTSKYELTPHVAAVTYQCLHRADPSFAW